MKKNHDPLKVQYESFKASKNYFHVIQLLKKCIEENRLEIQITEIVHEDLQIAKEALQSIASAHKPRHEKVEYWKKISHDQCAEVLATDTKIARNALKKIDKNPTVIIDEQF